MIRFPLVAAIIAVPWHFLAGDRLAMLPLRLLFVSAFALGVWWMLRRLGLDR